LVQDLLGGSLGKYQIEDEIGRGGFATVYRALDTTLDRIVALKVLAPHLIWDTTFVERFKQEARAAANLHHPNIVIIYEVHEIEGVHYIAMEHLAGRSLSLILDEAGALSPAQTADMVEQLASALDYTHASGLVHRDIKPSNIIVSDVGHVTLTDFGIVRAATGARLTVTGTIMGTPEYMSPEQVMEEEVGPGSDVYSLGLVCYEMLAGQTPFTGTTAAVLHAQAYEVPPPLRDFASSIPDPILHVIDRALAKDPAQRFSSAGDLARAFRGATEGVNPPPRPRPEPPRRIKHPQPAKIPAQVPESAPAAPRRKAGCMRRMTVTVLRFLALLLLLSVCGVCVALSRIDMEELADSEPLLELVEEAKDAAQALTGLLEEPAPVSFPGLASPTLPSSVDIPVPPGLRLDGPDLLPRREAHPTQLPTSVPWTDSLLSYVSGDLGLSLSYPATWHVQEEADVILITPDIEALNANPFQQPLLVVGVFGGDQAAGPPTSEGIVDVWLDTLPGDIDVYSLGEMTIGSQTWDTVEVFFVDPDNGIDMYGQMGVTVWRGVVPYVFVATAPWEEWDLYLPSFDQVLVSLQLSGPTGG
jgi:serine/threonine protein kinase